MKKELPPHMAGSSPETVLEIFEDGQKVFLEVFYIFKTYGKRRSVSVIPFSFASSGVKSA